MTMLLSAPAVTATLSATLSAANDAGIVDSNLGARFASCVMSTALNAGFDELTTAMLGTSGDTLLTDAERAEIIRNWRGLIVRVYLGSELAWMGRCSRFEDGPRQYDYQLGWLRPLTITWRGFLDDLEREQPNLSDDYTDEGSHVSADEIVRLVIDQSSSLIAKKYGNVAATSTDIGPRQTSMQDTSLSLILNALQAGAAGAVEHTILVWNPYDGPYVVPIGFGPTRWRMSRGDATLVWDIREYVSDAICVYTDKNSGSQSSALATSTLGPLLHNGLRAYRTTSADSVSNDGAEDVRDAFLALHEDPYGLSGNLTAIDTIENDEGALEPAWRVHAGDIVVVPDALPYDQRLDGSRALRSWAVKATSYDAFTGQLTVTLDDRAIASRQWEQMNLLRLDQRRLEPGGARSTLVRATTVGTSATHDVPSTADVVDIIALETDGVLTFTVTRSGTALVTLQGRFNPDNASTGNLFLGFSLDGDPYDTSQNDRTVRVPVVTASSRDYFVSGKLPIYLTPGVHTVVMYSESGAGVTTLADVVLEVAQ